MSNRHTNEATKKYEHTPHTHNEHIHVYEDKNKRYPDSNKHTEKSLNSKGRLPLYSKKPPFCLIFSQLRKQHPD